MKVWGIITARKGSVRLKDKNILKFLNKPLIEWSYMTTSNSSLDKIILSTDCQKCIKIAENYKKIEIPFLRPEEISKSETSHIDVIKHCLTYYKKEDLPDFIAIIQPTTPQRTSEDIDYLLNYIKQNNNINGLSTFSEDGNVIQKTYYYDNGEIKSLNFNKILRSQEGNKSIYENGLLYIFRTNLLTEKKFSDKYIGSLPFDNIKSLLYPKNKKIIDIDTMEDFKEAEYKIKSKEYSKKIIQLGKRIISDNSKPFVIAEVGINHEGDMNKAIKMIYDAYYAGCECVKFQCHIPEKEMTQEAKKVIPGNADKSIYDIIERTSLTEDQEIIIKETVEKLGMIYLCTPFSIEAADRLEKMGVQGFKIGSGEMNNLQLIEHVAKFGKPMFISTGMNPLRRIRKTVEVLNKYNVPYSLFHCVSMYPTPYNKVNFPGIDDLKNEFPDIIIGLSDHSVGITSCYGAYMKGCQIFEKHYTSYKNWSGPDIEISINPFELKKLINDLEILKQCKEGTGRLEIQKEEQVTIDFAYCSLTTTRELKKGHILQKNDLIAKRPNIGDFLAEDIDYIIGKKININIGSDEKIFKHMLA